MIKPTKTTLMKGLLQLITKRNFAKIEVIFCSLWIVLIVYVFFAREDESISRLIAISIGVTMKFAAFAIIAIAFFVSTKRILKFYSVLVFVVYCTFIALHGARAGYLTLVTYKAAFWSTESLIWIPLPIILAIYITRFAYGLQSNLGNSQYRSKFDLVIETCKVAFVATKVFP